MFIMSFLDTLFGNPFEKKGQIEVRVIFTDKGREQFYTLYTYIPYNSLTKENLVKEMTERGKKIKKKQIKGWTQIATMAVGGW